MDMVPKPIASSTFREAWKARSLRLVRSLRPVGWAQEDHLCLRAATGGDHRNEPTVSEAWAVLFLDGFWTGLDRVKTCQASPFG